MFLCFFTNLSDFNTFHYPTDAKEFHEVVARGECVVLHNVYNDTYNKTFTANKPGYYYASVSPPPNHMLNMLQITVSVAWKFYNVSDIQDHRVACSLSEVTSKCEICDKSDHQDMCLLLYATRRTENNDFSLIDVRADKRPLVESSLFLISVIVGTGILTFLCGTLVILLVVMCACKIKPYS